MKMFISNSINNDPWRVKIEKFIVVILSIFPFHAYIVDYLNMPNFWRQLFCYIALFVIILIGLKSKGGSFPKINLLSLGIFFLLIFINMIGYFFGLIKDIPLEVINNAFLLSVGFLPLLVIMVFLKSYISFYLNLSWVAAVVVSLGAVFEKLTGEYIVPDKYQSLNNLLSSDGVYRVGSVFGDALTLGPYLAIFFLYGLWIAESSRYKIAIYLMQIVIILGILFSGVRSAYVITFVGIVLHVLPRKLDLRITRKKLSRLIILPTFLIFLLPIVAVSAAYLPSGVSDFFSVQSSRMANIFNTNKDVGNIGRINNYSLVYEEATKSIANLFLGVGYGLSTNYNPNITGGQVGKFSAENQYLKIIFEQGLLGILIFTLFIILLFNRISSEKYEYRDIFLIILICFLLHMIFVPTLNSTFLNFLFYSFAGLFLSGKKNSASKISGGKNVKH